MQFKDIHSHQALQKQLIRGVQEKRVAHAQLFLGSEGSGNLPLALAYAQYLCCTNPNDEDSCGECRSCKRAAKYQHPDMHYTFPTVGKDAISKDFYAEWRTALQETPYMNEFDWLQRIQAENKQGNITKKECISIIKQLNLKTFESPYKVQIIWLAEKLRGQGNTLLKTIEEPPDKTVILLVAQNEEKILQTILSRTQISRVGRMERAGIQQYLEQEKQIETNQARQIAVLSEGNMHQALHMLEDTEEDNTTLLLEFLSFCAQNNILKLSKWVDEVAKLGREAQKNFIRYTLFFFREVLKLQISGEQKLTILNENEQNTAQVLFQHLNIHDIEKLNTIFNKAYYYIERNVNAKILFFNISIQLTSILKK